MTDTENRPVACFNCDWTGTENDLDDEAWADEMREYSYHISAGEEWPAGVCPTGCGGSVFLAKERQPPGPAAPETAAAALPDAMDDPEDESDWIVPVFVDTCETWSGTVRVRARTADGAKHKIELGDYEDLQWGKSLQTDHSEVTGIDDAREITAA